MPDSHGLQRKLNTIRQNGRYIYKGQMEKRTVVCAPHQSHCGEA